MMKDCKHNKYSMTTERTNDLEWKNGRIEEEEKCDECGHKRLAVYSLATSTDLKDDGMTEEVHDTLLETDLMIQAQKEITNEADKFNLDRLVTIVVDDLKELQNYAERKLL